MNTLKKYEHRVVIKIPTYKGPVHFSNLEMHQEMLRHTHFRFLWNISEDFRTDSSQALQNFQNFLDMEITFCFYTSTAKEIYYKGVITGMKMENTDGATVGYWITGTSSTIIMDDFQHNRTHLQKTLAEIIEDTFKIQIMGLWGLGDINPRYTKKINSSMQSDESDWEYVTRLAKQHGEWFYYNGQKIAFAPKESGIVLKNGNTLQKFTIEAALSSNKSALSGYDYRQATRIQSEQEHTQDHFADDMLHNAIRRQHRQYTRRLSDTPYSRYTPEAQNQDAIERMRYLDNAAKAAQMVRYTGTTREPFTIGSIITIEDQGRRHSIIIIQCTFESVGTGNLTNTFTGIPADCQFPPYTNPLARGFAYDQPAIVIDNNDPEGLSRIKVNYFWNNTSGKNESDWIRVQTLYSGKDKGMYWIPEIGEEVRVCFEGNHPDAPYVSGSNYNGKEKSGFATSGNDLKILQTRSGIKIKCNDAEGSLTLEDPSGNTIFIDGKGNHTITVPDTMTLNIGKDFKINVGNTMTIDVRNNLFIEVMQKLKLIANRIKERIHTNKESTIEGDLTQTTGSTTHTSKTGDIVLQSEGIAKVLGKIDAKVNKN